jgi:hypothetical protein
LSCRVIAAIRRVQINSESGAFEAPRYEWAAALDDKPQFLVAGKVDGGGDVLRGFDSYGINARLRGPSVDPAGGLGQIDLVADEIRVFEFAK